MIYEKDFQKHSKNGGLYKKRIYKYKKTVEIATLNFAHPLKHYELTMHC